MTPELSIIVAVYNVDSFLHECINSILSQTFNDFELILVDDGSTDNSSAICDEYAQKDSRIKVIHKKNGGVVSARKAGIQAARGIYAGYVDGDDMISPHMYEDMMQLMKKHDCDMVMCDIEHEKKPMPFSTGYTSTRINGGFYNRADMERHILPHMLYSGKFYNFGIYPVIWNKLYKREKLLKHQMLVSDSIKIGEDAACVYPYLLEAQSMYFMEGKSLYYYRHSGTQMTAAYDSEYLNSFKTLYTFFENSNIAASPYSQQLVYYYAYMLKNTVSNELRSANTSSFTKKLQNIEDIIRFALSTGFLDRADFSSLPAAHRLYFCLLRKNHPFLLASGICFIRFIQKIFR